MYAHDIGCDYIETDVQITSDGIPYIFHDEDLSRIVGEKKNFNELSSQEVDELIIFSDQKIPTLRSVLESLPTTLFQIDVKTDDVALPALKVIEECNALNRVCIASFFKSKA
jgi:glycerophosphoryl diester phosphodiesterase